LELLKINKMATKMKIVSKGKMKMGGAMKPKMMSGGAKPKAMYGTSMKPGMMQTGGASKSSPKPLKKATKKPSLLDDALTRAEASLIKFRETDVIGGQAGRDLSKANYKMRTPEDQKVLDKDLAIHKRMQAEKKAAKIKADKEKQKVKSMQNKKTGYKQRGF